MISSRLGLDHDRVLGSRYSFPLIARYLTQRGGRITDHKERGKLLYSYVHTFLVALLIDEPIEVEEAVNRAGFQFFTTLDSFREYVNREILAGSSA